jgi:hypothetical protein
MKLRPLGLAVFVSNFVLPMAGAAECYAASAVTGSPVAERVRFVDSATTAVDASDAGGCSLHSGAPARDTMTLGVLGVVVLLVVRRLLQASC